LHTGIDSLLYNSVTLYFKEESQSEFEKLDAKVAGSLKVGNTTYRAYTLFNIYGCKSGTGWLTYTDILSKLEIGKNYVFYYESTTIDDNIIHSPYKYKITVNALTTTGVRIVSYPFDEI
jgi:hypothetical protein